MPDTFMYLSVMDVDLNKLAQAECYGVLSSTHLLQQFCQSQELLRTKPREKTQQQLNKHTPKYKQRGEKKPL